MKSIYFSVQFCCKFIKSKCRVTGFEHSLQCGSLAELPEVYAAGILFLKRSDNIIARRRRCLRDYFSPIFLLYI